MRRTNPFKKIYQICNSGNSKFKMDHLPEFPRYIDIELTNNCNFHCLMCPVGTMVMKRKRGIMNDHIFNKIIEGVKPHKTPLRFIRFGEPMLHPKFIEYVKIAKEAGSLVHLNTNGSFLTTELIDELISIPIDSIKFSFQGIDRKSYKEMRNIDYFDELMDKIRIFYERRDKAGYPYIHISTTVTYESAGEIEKFKKKVSRFVDLVTVGSTVLEHIDIEKVKLSEKERSTLISLKKKESVVKEYSECPEVFDKLSVNFDGTVSACCGDWDNKMLVGDINTSSLKNIWMSGKMSYYRKMLLEMRHKELELCKTCYDYHGLHRSGSKKREK